MWVRSSLPLYAKVRNDLRSRIQSGEFTDGEPLPPEPELQTEYEVSRITLRRAVEELAQSGFVTKVPGRGTFVTRTAYDATLMTLGSFGSDAGKFKDAPRRRVLEKFSEDATAEVAEQLRIGPGGPIIGLRRLLLDGDTAIAYDTTRYPLDLLPGFLDHIDDDVSTFGVLQEVYGHGPITSTGTISARSAATEEARILKVSPGDPLIVIDKVILAEAGTPIALSTLMVDPSLVHISFSTD